MQQQRVPTLLHGCRAAVADGQCWDKVLSPVWHSASQRWGAKPGSSWDVGFYFFTEKLLMLQKNDYIVLQIVGNLLRVAVVDAENLGIFCYPHVWYYESCVCAFMYAVCELACCRPSLRLFQEPALYSVSDTLFCFLQFVCTLFQLLFSILLPSTAFQDRALQS